MSTNLFVVASSAGIDDQQIPRWTATRGGSVADVSFAVTPTPTGPLGSVGPVA
jgi:hypothetical protein